MKVIKESKVRTTLTQHEVTPGQVFLSDNGFIYMKAVYKGCTFFVNLETGEEFGRASIPDVVQEIYPDATLRLRG